MELFREIDFIFYSRLCSNFVYVISKIVAYTEKGNCYFNHHFRQYIITLYTRNMLIKTFGRPFNRLCYEIYPVKIYYNVDQCLLICGTYTNVTKATQFKLTNLSLKRDRKFRQIKNFVFAWFH